MKKRILCLLLTVCLLTGCGHIRENPAATTEPTAPENTQTYITISSYGYYIENPRLPEEIREQLNAFGSIILPEPSVRTETYTEIPEPENDAKGVDPVFRVLPDLDPGKYKGPYIWDDSQTGWQITAAYRQVAGMLTDELVKVYIDNGGNICQYETVNFGRYDQLELSDRYLESARLHFDDAIQTHLGAITWELYNSKQHHAPSAYRLFMDVEGNLVLTTTAVLTEDAGTVELYAILKMGNLYE